MLKQDKQTILKEVELNEKAYKSQVSKEAAESAVSMAKTIASHTITDVVIPAIQETLKNKFNFDETQLNDFMSSFTEEADKLMSAEKKRGG